MGDELANGYIKILTLFMEKYDRDDHELYGIQEKLFKHILQKGAETNTKKQWFKAYVTQRIVNFAVNSIDDQSTIKLACSFLEELNGVEGKTEELEIAIQMTILAIFIRPELIEQHDVANVIINMLQKKQNLNKHLLHDLNQFIGRYICQLISTEKKEEDPYQINSATSLIMQSDLLSGGLQPHLFCYFAKQDLQQMADDARVGNLTDVQEQITEALTALDNKEFEAKFNEED